MSGFRYPTLPASWKSPGSLGDYEKSIPAVVSTAQAVKKFYEQAGQQGLIGLILSEDILNKLTRIQQISLTVVLIQSPNFAADVVHIEWHLKSILERNQAIREQEKSRWNLSATLRRVLPFSPDVPNELNKELAIIQTKIQEHLKILETTYLARKESLNHIETAVQGRVYKAETDVTLADALVGVPQMDPSQLSRSFLKSKTALESANLSSDLLTRYLQLKVKTLERAIAGLPISQKFSSEKARQPGVNHRRMGSYDDSDEETDMDRSDPFIMLIKILKDLGTAGHGHAYADQKLHTLSLNIAGWGMTKEAAEISEWELQIHRIARASPIIMCNTLLHHSKMLIAAKKSQEALVSLQECASIARQNIESERYTWVPKLCSALHILALLLDELGIHGDQVRVLEESVETYRRFPLFRNNNSELANALMELSVALRRSERYQESLRACEESVDLHRKLASLQPKEHSIGLASCLSALGDPLCSLGRFEDASKSLSESIELFKELVSEHTKRSTKGLASSYAHLGYCFSQMGRYASALEASKASVTYSRELAKEGSPDMVQHLCLSLSSMAYILNKAGHCTEARDVSAESVTISRGLVKEDSIRFSSFLATSLTEAARSHLELRLYREAISIAEEGLQSQLNLFKPDPGVIAARHIILSYSHSYLEQHQEAVDTGKKALKTIRSLYAKRPSAFMRDIAEFLLRYSVVLRRQGDLDGAKTAAEESVSFYRRLVKTPGFDYKAELKEALKNLSEILAQGAKRTMEEASAL